MFNKYVSAIILATTGLMAPPASAQDVQMFDFGIKALSVMCGTNVDVLKFLRVNEPTLQPLFFGETNALFFKRNPDERSTKGLVTVFVTEDQNKGAIMFTNTQGETCLTYLLTSFEPYTD